MKDDTGKTYSERIEKGKKIVFIIKELILQDASYPTLITGIVLKLLKGWSICRRRNPRVIVIASPKVIITVIQ